MIVSQLLLGATLRGGKIAGIPKMIPKIYIQGIWKNPKYLQQAHNLGKRHLFCENGVRNDFVNDHLTTFIGSNFP